MSPGPSHVDDRVIVRLALLTGRLARVGCVSLLIGLIVPALIDLSIQALGAPFFLPVAATGLVLLGVGERRNPRVGRASRVLLVFIGVSLGVAFAWALVPGPLSDLIGGVVACRRFA